MLSLPGWRRTWQFKCFVQAVPFPPQGHGVLFFAVEYFFFFLSQAPIDNFANKADSLPVTYPTAALFFPFDGKRTELSSVAFLFQRYTPAWQVLSPSSHNSRCFLPPLVTLSQPLLLPADLDPVSFYRSVFLFSFG